MIANCSPVLRAHTIMPVPDDVVAPSPVLAATVVDSKLRTPSLPAPTSADIAERLTQIVSHYL